MVSDLIVQPPLEFPIPFMVGVWIFSGTTHYLLSCVASAVGSISVVEHQLVLFEYRSWLKQCSGATAI